MILNCIKDYDGNNCILAGSILIVLLLLFATPAAASTTTSELGGESATAVETLDIPAGDSIFLDANYNEGPPSDPATPIKGNAVTLPVVMVEFNDAKATKSTTQVRNDFFGQSSRGGIRDYYFEVSDGQLDYVPGPQISSWVNLGMDRSQRNDRSFYQNKYPNINTNAYNLQQLFAYHSLKEVDKNVDFSQYDSDKNGRVDVIIVYQGQNPGYGDALSPTGMDFQPNFQTQDTETINQNGQTTQVTVEIDNAMLSPEQNGAWLDNKGVNAHEMGHTVFGWGDVYEPQQASQNGISLNNQWSLMGNGAYGGRNQGTSTPIHIWGSDPIPPLAWRKTKVGWADSPAFYNNGILPPASLANDFYTYSPSQSATGEEGYLSFRQETGADSALRDWQDSIKNQAKDASQITKAQSSNYRGLLSTVTNVGKTIKGTWQNNAKVQIDYMVPGEKFKYWTKEKDANGQLIDVEKEKDIQYDHGTLLIGNPEKKQLKADSKLKAGSKYVFAMNTQGQNRVGARVSWDDPTATMDLIAQSEVPGPKKTLIEYSTQKPGFQQGYNAKRKGTYASLHFDPQSPTGKWKLLMDSDRDVSFYHSETHETAVLPSRVELSIANGEKIYKSDSLQFDVKVRAGDNEYPVTKPNGLNSDNFDIWVDGTKFSSNEFQVQYISQGTHHIEVKSVSNKMKLNGIDSHELKVRAKDTKYGVGHETDKVTHTFSSLNEPPNVAFDWTADGLDVEFNSRSTDPDGNDANLDFEWDLGDETKDGPSTEKRYKQAGGYPVTLTVTDEDGGKASVTETVRPSLDGTFTVQNVESAGYMTAYSKDRVGDLPIPIGSDPQSWEISLTDQSNKKYRVKNTKSGKFLNEKVNFIDDNEAIVEKKADINNQKWFFEPLEERNIYYIKSSRRFVISKWLTGDTSNNEGQIELWNWNAGNAQQWRVTQVASSPETHRPPDATMRVEGSDYTRTFTAANVKDPNGQITKYEWDFGEGEPIEKSPGETSVDYTYSDPGEYSVSLTIYDNDGDSRTIVKKVPVVLRGTYKIENVQAGGLLTSQSNGELKLKPDNGGQRQIWKVKQVPDPKNPVKKEGITYQIIDVRSGNTIKVRNKVAPFTDYAVLRTWKNDRDYRWRIKQRDKKKGHYTVENIGFYSLLGKYDSTDVEANSMSSYSGPSRDYNRWKLIRVEEP